MILFPPAKVNLGLKVLGKRDDGYHELESCMLSINLVDVLELTPSEQFEFKQTGLTIDGDAAQNLIVKAYRLLHQHYGIGPVRIHLLKNIPMGAGLGGGSADAAYTLRGLNEYFKLNISNDELRMFASQLGSDCSFFIEDKPQIATGRGELLTPISVDLSGYYLKIVNPGIHIGTAEAYRGVQFSKEGKSVATIIKQGIASWKTELRNDFETSVFTSHPVLEQIKESLYKEGAVYSSMSGSGSTMYGLYRDKPIASFQQYFERIMKL